jgi:hypothetical protein
MLLSLAAYLLMAGSEGVILRPVANMYSKPSEDADVVSQAIYGAPVIIIEQQGGWLRVRTSDDYTGWVPAAAVKPGAYARAQRVATVDSLMAHLYRTPSVTRHAPLLTVPYETRLEVVAEPDNDDRRWIQVRLPDDRAAYVQRGDVSFDPGTLDVPAMIQLAKRFLGLPYTWGGTSSFGYDCSGYTQMLCRRMGKSLPRDAGPQARWEGMQVISKDELAPGDLLYFGPSEKRITHTGMYIGDGEFIHASTHTKPVVQISRLADEHWTTLLVGCRRLK